jgi:hypothetical protein
MRDDEGYRCERCGFTATGINAKHEFRDHVLRHEYRIAGGNTLRTPYKPDDGVFLKVNRIKNDFDDEDAA